MIGISVNGYDVVLNRSNITFRDCSVENTSGIINVTSGEINIFHSKIDFANVSAKGNVFGIACVVESNSVLKMHSSEVIMESIEAY